MIYREVRQKGCCIYHIIIVFGFLDQQHDSRLEIEPVLDDVWNVDYRSTGKEGVLLCILCCCYISIY